MANGRTIRDLITSQTFVLADQPVPTVVDQFEAQPQLDGFAVLDGPRILFVSRTRLFLRLGRPFGYPLFQRRPIGMLADPATVVPADADLTAVITDAVERPDERIYDDIVVTEGGEYAGTVSMRSLLTHHKDLLVTSLAAITHLDEKNQQLGDQLRQAMKMEAVGRLAGGVAHDFNNLLTVMMGYAEQILMSPAAAEEKTRARAQGVLAAGGRGAALTSQLLAFSRRQQVHPRVMDLNPVVLESTRLLGRLLSSTVRLRTVLGSRMRPILADSGQIEQVVMNLVVNARDAMPAGGDLTIETREADLDDPLTARHLRDRAGPHVVLEVSDTGVGMTEEVQALIFEPFFTTKEAGKGTGLGLAMVYGIVEQNNGHIAVWSRPGAGTTFSVYFPCTVPAEAKAEAPAPSREDLRGDGTVLLVEDEAGVREVVGDLLRRSGYHVVEAAHGAEAVRQAQTYPSFIDLLLTDVVMPGMSGREAADQIVALRPGIRVLYMSGYADDVLGAAAASKELDVVQKPVSAENLLRRIRRALESTPSRHA